MRVTTFAAKCRVRPNFAIPYVCYKGDTHIYNWAPNELGAPILSFFLACMMNKPKTVQKKKDFTTQHLKLLEIAIQHGTHVLCGKKEEDSH